MRKKSSTPSSDYRVHPSRGELNMNTKNTSTPPFDYKRHPSRGEFWDTGSLYPYWEIPKNKLLISRAKELRKAGNLAEVIFWKTFNDKNKIGFDIDRQVIVGNYIVDFFIPELGLVFEIDGSSHDNKIDYDAERDAFMNDLGLFVIRIPDVDVKKNMESVYNFVTNIILERTNKLKGFS